jgi:hypothetical protein
MRKDLSSRRAIGRSRADRQIYSFRRLPKLHPIPLGIDKPPESPVVVVLRLRIDHRSGCLQFRQHSVQIIDLKIQHGRLRNRKVIRSLRKKRHRDIPPLRLPWKGKHPSGTGPLIPRCCSYHAYKALGSAARKNAPPNPVTLAINSPNVPNDCDGQYYILNVRSFRHDAKTSAPFFVLLS